ncbi:N-6 DNA methylase [Bacillus cereus]|uniref:N-6 DNA methylase n=1 Tax=Bacillus cereus TaxID=1396 RepID=UPI000B5F07A5|nr:N-6 DNA methylase [Bacillus cereus]ASJ47659.1 hypothetical protein BA204_06250 [Bacillus cereus]
MTFAIENFSEINLPLSTDGKIIDFLEPDKHRPNTPEERNRQIYTQILVNDYNYPKDHIALEVPIQIGTDTTKRADIVVYRSKLACKTRDLTNVRLIVEVKAANISDGERQLYSYLFATSAEGGVWFNGQTKYYIKDTDILTLKEYPGIPKHRQSWETVGAYKKSDLIKPLNLKPVFKKCHNSIYKTGINSEDVAMDMVRILLAKYTDETNAGEECEFRCTPDELRTPEGIKQVADRVKHLFSQVKEENPEVFAASEEITCGDIEIATVVTQLQQYSFLEAPYDVIGTAYETYVSSHLKGERGQFFTNRLVVDLMVGMIDPGESDTVLDPACGSGGFLLQSLNYVSNKIQQTQRNDAAKDRAFSLFRHKLFGIDKTPKLVKVARANMLLGKDGHTGLIHHDSLSSFNDLPTNFASRAGKEMPSIILANPPFGASAVHKITDTSILNEYKSAQAFSIDENNEIKYEDKLVSGVAPEILFLERCIEWAKPGGKIGIVMARGALDNRDSTLARKLIMDKTKILAIVNCHDDTFEPYCGSKASFLILQKKTELELQSHEEYRIFMAISNKIGQTSRGEPIFKRNENGKMLIRDGSPILDHDMDDILESYKNWRLGNPISYEFSFEISSNLIETPYYNLNPVKFLPRLNSSLEKVIQIGEKEDWELRRLGDIATVFNGPRFKRPYADNGVTHGEGILRYYTGTAFTQTKGDNIKYLDYNKANKQQKKHLDELVIHQGWILITDSGTLGRVIYARQEHEGVVATNNLIRVVIEDPILRAYIYQFLTSELGQNQMLRHAYGTNQLHIEPWHVSDILIPFPSDENAWREIGTLALQSIDLMERSRELDRTAKASMKTIYDEE